MEKSHQKTDPAGNPGSGPGISANRQNNLTQGNSGDPSNRKKSRKRSSHGSASTDGTSDAGTEEYPTLLSRGLGVVQLGGGLLVILALFIGPLLAGSYYDPWRWPLIYVSCAAALLLIISTRRGKSSNSSPGWILAALLAWPVIQGVWMYYNAWGEFSQTRYFDPTYLPWRISQLAGQPFPSLPGTADKAEAIDRLSYILPCLGLVWGARQIVVSRPSWCQRLAKTIFWSGVAVAIIGLLQRSTGATAILWLDELDQGLIRKFFFATYRSPGIATCFLNVSLALGLSCALNALRLGADEDYLHDTWRSRHPMAYLLMVTAGVIILICAVISAGSKAGMALGVLTIILFCILNRNAIKKALSDSTSQLFFGNRLIERNLFIGAVICITAFLLLSFAGMMSDRWMGAHKLDYSSLTGRIQANEVMLKMVQDDGWGAMGMGPGSFYPLFPYYTAEIEGMIMGVWAYAHNDYLQTLVEWGWLGTGFLAACIGGGYLILLREISLYRQHHSKRRFIHYRGYLLAMTTFLLHASIEFPFQIESLAVVFSVMLGVAWASPGLRGRDIRVRPKDYGPKSHPRKRDRYYRTRHRGDHLRRHH